MGHHKRNLQNQLILRSLQYHLKNQLQRLFLYLLSVDLQNQLMLRSLQHHLKNQLHLKKPASSSFSLPSFGGSSKPAADAKKTPASSKKSASPFGGKEKISRKPAPVVAKKAMIPSFGAKKNGAVSPGKSI